MAELSQRPIIITTRENNGEGLLHIQGLDTRQRMIRAAKIWGLMWLLMVFSIPLIIIHFVLIPAFFIAGPVMAFRRYGVTELPHHVDGNCPSCKQSFTLPAETLPMWAQCPACKAWLSLSEKK